MRHLPSRITVAIGICLLISACGGGGSSSFTPEVLAPTTVQLAGIAADGYALAGASMEVIGPNGQRIEIPASVTGTDGSYSITLTTPVRRPMVVSARRSNGSRLSTIVDTVSDTESMRANINPITSLVMRQILADASLDDSAATGLILESLGQGRVATLGQELVSKALGADITYASFHTDPGFRAKTDDTSGSAADAVLDVLSLLGVETDQDITTLLSQAVDDDGEKLAESPAFQIRVVGELIIGGHTSDALVTELTAIGLLKEEEEASPRNLARAIVDELPLIFESSKQEVTAISDDMDALVARAIIGLVANTAAQSEAFYGGDDESTISMLSSPGFRQSIAGVVQAVASSLLVPFDGSEEDQVVLASILDQVLVQTARLTSAIPFGEETDIAGLVTALVRSNILPEQGLTTVDLARIRNGEITISDLVREVDDANQAITLYLAQNPGALSKPITLLTLTTSNDRNWNQANWGRLRWASGE